MEQSSFNISFLVHLLRSRLFSKHDDVWPAAAKQAAQGLISADHLRKSELKQEQSPAVPPSKVAAKQADVLIVSALAKEQRAALAAFGIEPSRSEDENIDGHKIYFCECSMHDQTKLRITIAAVNSPRNANMALVTQHLLSRYSPADAFLCGITASRPDKTNFCDVFPSTRVWDIAGGREEFGGTKRRDEPYTPPTRMKNFLDYFDPARASWKDRLRGALNDARQYTSLNLVSDEVVCNLDLKITPGIFFADETLMADGDWTKLVDRDQRAVAREMESSGFAQACDNRVGWLVFKSCSDFGDSEKHDDFHQTAAFTAAFALRLFLETEYRPALTTQRF